MPRASQKSHSSLPARDGFVGCRANSSVSCLIRGKACKVRLGKQGAASTICVANAVILREQETVYQPGRTGAQGQKQGYLPKKKQDNSSPADPAGSQPLPAGDLDDADTQCWSRMQGAMHRGGHHGSRDVHTSPRPTSPHTLRRGPSSAGTSLRCQATPKLHPFKAEKETAGRTCLHVTWVTQACRHKLHTSQVTFAVMGGGWSEAV